MSISVSCSDCGKGYKVDDRFAGKKAKCKACGGALNIPALAAAAPAVASTPKSERSASAARGSSGASPRSTGQPARKAAKESESVSADLDLSSLAELETTGKVDEAAYEPVTAAEARRRAAELKPTGSSGPASANRGTSYAEALANRGAGKGKLAQKAAALSKEAEPFSLKSLQPKGFSGWLWASILVAGLLGLASQTLATYAAVGVVAIGLCFVTYGLILPGILARQEDVSVYLLYRYMPGYQLYFIISRWEETRKCVLGLIQGVFLMIVGAMLVLRAGPLGIIHLFYHPDAAQTDQTLAAARAARGAGPQDPTAGAAAEAEDRLRQIWDAANQFATAHENKFPGSLQEANAVAFAKGDPAAKYHTELTYNRIGGLKRPLSEKLVMASGVLAPASDVIALFGDGRIQTIAAATWASRVKQESIDAEKEMRIAQPGSDIKFIDPASPKGVAIAFIAAMASGDLGSMQNIAYNIDLPWLNAHATYLAAMRELNDAGTKQFASAAGPKPPAAVSPDQAAQTAARAIQDIPDQIDGDTATLAHPAEGSLILKKVDGAWRLDGSYLYRGEKSPAKIKLSMLDLQIKAKIIHDLTSDVSGGQYPTWAAVEKALQEKTKAAEDADEEYKTAKKAAEGK